MKKCQTGIKLAVLAAAMLSLTSWAESTRSVAGPTFGFAVEVPEPSAQEQAEAKQTIMQQMLKESDRRLEAKQAQHQLEREQTLLFVALQKLNGRTPLYGQERADLERIVAQSRAKIKELQQNYDLIIDRQTAERLQEAEQAQAVTAQKASYMLRSNLSSSPYSRRDLHLLEDAQRCKLSGGCNSIQQKRIKPEVSAHKNGFFSYGDDKTENQSSSSTQRPVAYGNNHSGQVRNNQTLQAVDNVLQRLERSGQITLEEEEEEQVTPVSSVQQLMSPEDLLNSKDGILIPNQPLHMTPEMREKVRAMVESSLRAKQVHMKAYERDVLNALLFNYGVQVLDDGRVITLETYLPDNYDTNRPMLAPGVPLPEGARQIVRAPVQQVTTSNPQGGMLIPESEFTGTNNTAVGQPQR